MTNTLPACTGVFMRSHCPHPRLFEEEYKRSYCGSSLEVLLRFNNETDDQEDSGSFAPFDISNVFVFAHFEVDGQPLSTTTYSLRYLRSVSQSEANPEGPWIEGVHQTAARHQHSQQLQPPLPPTNSPDNTYPETAAFVLNGQAYAKWYYHWGSGANKVQRATKHVLKAYVFYQTRTPESILALQGTVQQDQARDGALELLCVVTSPPFTVVSYRRAPLDASTGLAGPRTDATASMVPHYATDTAHPVDSRLRSLVQHQISRAFQEYNQHQHQHDPRGGSSDEPLRLRGDQDENQVSNDTRSTFDRYRQLQEREGLRFRLLTPEDASLSGSSLHSQIQTQGPRLVFDSIRRRNDQLLWRDASRDDGEDEICDEQSLERRSSDSEGKVSGPVWMQPSTTDPVRHGDIALRRFKQQQQQFDTHQRELQQVTDLAIVHFFVSHIATSKFGNAASMEAAFTIAISQHWQYASGEAAHLAGLLLSMAKSGGSQDLTVSRCTTERDQLLLVLAEVCVWAFSPDNIEVVQNLLAACHPLLLENVNSSGSGVVDEGKELREAYFECVGRCWGAMDRFLQTPRATQTTIHSVRALSDAVLGVVYSDPELESLRVGLRAMLQRPTIVLEDSKENISATSDAYDSVIPRCNLVGWQSFVAQVREGYLVQAEPSVLSRDNAWLRLICDSRVRVAPIAFNGLTSLIGGVSSCFGGDYVAYRLERQEPTINCICVEFYWWPTGIAQGGVQTRLTAFRSVVTLKSEPNGAFMEVRVNLERGVVENQTIVAAAFPQLELWSPAERVQAVAGWELWLSIEGVYVQK
ncbi:uncharacterized protein PITG_19840 [Phytophthora infestans T30-4]|uniref:Uncharacterized protein n=1 Tax=Phytophthora infestans (strain T30-4) TaxID=403677 RepID=D0P0V9_PHYIT|nr:uncharacterized protein PITG_19840 [Phytophthora infestans T30-4]EEY53666.1 conserved hypothetical protein [Phytophthora infestans T30-4]|eukprot:XP_002896052.1 conserved hypothetical protein [Phytophthora infestans T30-4]